MKVLAIHNILWAHYKARIFVGLHEALNRENIQFHVLQLAYSERSRWALKADISIHRYPYEVLFSNQALEDIAVFDKIKKLLTAVSKYRPDIIYLNGYYDVAYWFLFIYCKANGIKVILDFESNEISRERVWWRESLKKVFLKHCDGLVCLGKKAADYALKLGVKPERILSTKNVGVDNDALLQIYTKEYPERNERKKQLGLPRYNFLYAGRFVERKNLARLIKTFHEGQKAATNGSQWGLILSGEGEQKEKLQELVNGLNTSSVFFLEPCEWYEVPIRYTLSDVAVLPSTFEPFGFITNEAMVYSMPVLVSQRCGSAADLVIDHHNGFQFDPYDEKDLLEKILLFMDNPDLFNALGANGKRIIDQWSPAIIIKDLTKAILQVKETIHG